MWQHEMEQLYLPLAFFLKILKLVSSKEAMHLQTDRINVNESRIQNTRDQKTNKTSRVSGNHCQDLKSPDIMKAFYVYFISFGPELIYIS